MSDRQLATILHHIKNERRGGTPHDVWVSRNREILLTQVRNTTDTETKPGIGDLARHLFAIFMPAEAMMGMARAVGVFALVVGTVLGGGLASAQVYQLALPGDTLYNVKLAVESAQLLLAPTDDYRTRLHGDFADHRLDEVAQLAEGPANAQQRIPATLAAFDKEVHALNGGLASLRDSDPDGVVEVAKLMERKMAVYQNVLRKSAATVTPTLRGRFAASRDQVDDVSIASIAVIVEKHLAGSAAVPATVVQSKVEERLKLAEDKVAEGTVTERQTKAKAAIAEARELLKEDQYQAALTKIAEVAELTKEEDPAVTTPESDTSTTEEAPKEETPATAAPDAPAPTETSTEKPTETK